MGRLHDAASDGDRKAVKRLLKSGADFRAYVRENQGFRVGDDYQSLGAAVNMFSQSFA